MNGTIVCKFGGSSLADASGFQKAKNILLGNAKRRFAVPSAPGRRFDGDDKVTDLLYRCYQQVEKGEDCAETFAKIEERYLGIARELGLTMDVVALLKDTRAAIERVRTPILPQPRRIPERRTAGELSGLGFYRRGGTWCALTSRARLPPSGPTACSPRN